MLELVPKIIMYKSYRRFGFPKNLPINYAFSITHKCNLRCRTCSIWEVYKKDPRLNRTELTTEEFEKIFNSIDKNAFFVTLTGGEPFLRKDLVGICELLQKYCSPFLVNIATNGVTSIIPEYTKKILKTGMNLKINFSLDGTMSLHDKIRGVENTYRRLTNNYAQVKKMKKKYGNLNIGINTTVSSFNAQYLKKIYTRVKEKFQPDTFTVEVAENRAGFFNLEKKGIQPKDGTCRNTINHLINRTEADYSKSYNSRIITSSRVEFYKLLLETLNEKRQVTKCYAGFNACYVDPYGNVLPCCVLDESKSFGNLRKVNYDFKKIWFSKTADNIRDFIKTDKCYCMSVNSAYTNIFCDTSRLIRILLKLAK